MDRALHLDTAGGRLHAAGIAIDAGTRAGDLPEAFAKRTQRVRIETREVEVLFARASMQADGMTAALELRFEQALLASAFLALETPALRRLADADFHGSVDERWRFHARWLAAMGVPLPHADFAWGSAGVARDRGDGVHIYVHTRHNRWAHGQAQGASPR